LGSSIILGLCSVFGAIIPSIYYYFTPTKGKDTIADLFGTTWGLLVILGLAVCVLGIVICGKAGAMKDKDLIKHEEEHFLLKPALMRMKK
jgi:L-rhamnose-H+ transport protein